MEERVESHRTPYYRPVKVLDCHSGEEIVVD